MRVPYDLHIHSCLSPCADDDMTPANIAGMAYLKGLQLVALTDHNACGNCPAFFEACAGYGITPIAGMELTTAEDVHLVCLFPTLDAAASFDALVALRAQPIRNRPEIFGNQLFMSADDEPAGTEERFLLASSNIPINEAVDLVRERGGFVYPAHVDRESNGILAVLGDLPPEAGFTCAEFYDASRISPYLAQFPALRGLRLLSSSDAHRLGDIHEADYTLSLPACTADALLTLLRKKDAAIP